MTTARSMRQPNMSKNTRNSNFNYFLINIGSKALHRLSKPFSRSVATFALLDGGYLKRGNLDERAHCFN